MSDFLLGKEVSGTPLETRGGTRNAANDLQRLMAGQGSNFGRLATRSQVSALGFDPALLGLGDIVQRALTNPADATRGLFATMAPFERRTVSENVAGLRAGFGQLGGRFSRNAADAEGILRGELANQFARSREEALISAQGQQNDALSAILQLIQGARGQALTERGQILNFLQPGPAGFQEGALGDIIGAAANIYALKSLQGAGDSA